MSAERGRISPLEGSALVFSATVPWLLLYIPFMVIGAGGRDAWISKLLLIGAGFFVAVLVLALGSRFPGISLTGYAPLIVGRPLGVVIGVLYTWWTLSVAAILLRGFAGVLSVTVLPHTPEVVITGIMVFVCAVAVRGGLEVVARDNLVIIMTFLVGIALLLGLSAKDVDASQWFPILEKGWLPVVRGTYLALGFVGTESAVALLIVMPFLGRRRGALAALVYPAILLGVLGALIVLWSVGLYGVESSADRPFLVIDIARLIDIGDFLQNLDSIFIAFWVLLNFAKLSVWYYATTISLSDLLGLRDYRGLVWPLGVLIVELSYLFFRGEAEFYHFLYRITPYMLTFEVVIPCLLLAVAVIRGVRSNGEPSQTSTS